MNCRRDEALIMGGRDTDRIVALRFAGQASVGVSAMQTLLSAFDPGLQPRLWIGLRGPEQKLTLAIGAEPRRSPHYWHGHGPSFTPGKTFDFQLLIHTGMGPGGILSRLDDDDRWSSLAAASPWETGATDVARTVERRPRSRGTARSTVSWPRSGGIDDDRVGAVGSVHEFPIGGTRNGDHPAAPIGRTLLL